MAPVIDVDFSLAIYNRTGKYFVGRDILEDLGERVGSVYYWRLAADRPPVGLRAKLLGRALAVEDRVRARYGDSTVAAFRSRRPMLHMDPSTVVHAALRASDIVLCHDLGPLTHPELFAPAVGDLYRRAYAVVSGADARMVFVSQASMDAYRDLYGDNSDMRVIYPAIRAEIGGQGAPVAIPGPFLLTVGSVGNRKNQAASIAAFARSGLHQSGVSYVICGAREPGADAVAALAAATPGVILLPYVTDAELQWLYGAAAGFVLMSRLEGFGVPVAEAIARGLVPLVTADSVLEEVAGDGALTAPCHDLEAIAAQMNRLVALTPSERAERQQRLSQSIARFSREAFARAWSTLIDETAGRRQTSAQRQVTPPSLQPTRQAF
jgi:glycosyltransferase involved in cell wall biosynthesis